MEGGGEVGRKHHHFLLSAQQWLLPWISLTPRGVIFNMKQPVAFLIPSEEAEHIGEIPGYFESGEEWFIPEDETETWVSLTVLEGFRSIGRDPKILQASEELSIFYDQASPIDKAGHADELTARALSLDPKAVGVAYVGCGYEREFAIEFMTWMERFFCYSQKESRPFIWLILSDPVGQYDETGREVARWAYNALYCQDENFKAWLGGLGFNLDAEYDDEQRTAKR